MLQTFAGRRTVSSLYMILITYTGVLLRKWLSEKNKIMEVVFSSIRASHYFYARMHSASCDFDPYWHLRHWVDLLPFFSSKTTNLGTIWYF